jgi:hypothetical protein
MIIKHKLYKIALVSIAMVFMLISTAGAFPFCGCGCGDHFRDHSCNDKLSDDSSNKCIVCPGCPTCPTCPACNCPTCAAPALKITKTGSITGRQNDQNGLRPIITYNYTLTNTGNVGLNGIVIYDNITSPTGMPVTTITTLDPNASVTVNTTYNVTSTDLTCGHVTNTAYATAFGSLINIISNIFTYTINFPS